MARAKIIFLNMVLLLLPGFPSQAQLSGQNASSIFSNFMSTFYTSSGGNGKFIWQQGGSFDKDDLWENVEMIEIATDRYLVAPNNTDSNYVTALLNGFDSAYGGDWTSDIYNDDIMWAVLAHARAYMAIYYETGTINASMINWAVNASNNFCWVYDGGHAPGRVLAQYDNTFGGGMWWSTNHLGSGTKNSCVNGPAALAGFYLSLIYPEAGFWGKATNMINWETANLVQSDGFLYDHYATNGPVGSDLSYNVGTYVGAAGFLGIGVPDTVANYFMNHDCTGGILPNYSTGGGNNDGFNGIFLRWVGTYEFLSAHTNWQTFFTNQANAAWAVANASGLSWDDWNSNTPSGSLYSWDCSASVVALQFIQFSQNPVPPMKEVLSLTNALGQQQLSWTYGTLQTATSPSGPYNDLTNALSPYSMPGTNSVQFYRVKEN